MKKRIMVVLLVAVSLLLFTHTAMAAYDSAQVKASMKQVAQLLKDLNAKATAKDYYTAAEKFMDLARIFKNLDSVTPPKGSKADWDRIHNGFIASAFKGIGACGAKNDKTIKQAIGELIKFRNEGHKLFLP